MLEPTRTDPTIVCRSEWQLDDLVIQLREWGTDHAYELPTAAQGEWMVGADRTCAVRLADTRSFVSRRHAKLSRDSDTWMLTDNRSKNGLWLDDARRPSFVLTAGVEVGIGSLRLVAESPRLIALRAFVSRMIGWADDRRSQVDRALRSLRQMATRRAPLLLLGDGNLVAMARALHRRTLGDKHPFVVSDPRRQESEASPRSPANHVDVHEAVRAAARGTLCMWANRLPMDLDSVREEVDQSGGHVRLIICAHSPKDVHGGISVGASIALTPLSERAREIDRIIDGYAADAIVSLCGGQSRFAAVDHAWMKIRRPRNLTEIETTVTRLIAIREFGGITNAARHLGITHAALSHWVSRRR